MARPVAGKTYLWVTCRSCHKHFRVFDEPLYEGKAVEVREPLTLKCRGCGKADTFAPAEMIIGEMRRFKKQG